jgi:hypothetical protein
LVECEYYKRKNPTCGFFEPYVSIAFKEEKSNVGFCDPCGRYCIQEEKFNVGLRSPMWVFNLKAFNPLSAFVTLMWVLQVRC